MNNISSKEIYDLKAPFAPGTYIELFLENNDDIQRKWGFFECDSQAKMQLLFVSDDYLQSFDSFSTLVDIDEDGELECNDDYNATLIEQENTNKIGFSLPLYRTKETKFEKYYIVVFAYEGEMPTLQDPYVIIDMSFRVGIGEDDNVTNGVNLANYPKNIQEWNQISHIQSVWDAVKFFEYLSKKIGDTFTIMRENFFSFCKNNPQIAGKIAYIYYRFDLGSQSFIDSVENDFKDYQRDRDFYFQTCKDVLLNCPIEKNNPKTLKEKYDELMQGKKLDIAIYKNLISKIATAICEKLDLNLITKNGEIDFFQGDEEEWGEYYKRRIRVNENNLHDLKEIIKTMIHEIRHFYVETYYYPGQGILRGYLFYAHGFSISDDYKILFDGFYKFDDKERQENAYEIQPNERDARFVEKTIDFLG
ncbi:hypothetical protein [Campylobacter sp. LMG 17559]|uniref:hypothetical protein n=1 Tax=Campylobacter sp. LMG 17559 TaxID=2735748 RepID=UPI00301D6CC5|nr:hypothetical protein [Campylobacter sp. LMG 17559]